MQLFLDDTGDCLSHGNACGSDADDFPWGESFVVGGPKGIAPYVFETRN